MKKWFGPFLSLLLVILFISFSGFSNILKQGESTQADRGELRIFHAQDIEKEGKKGDTDSHFILILKQVREKLDAWLKSLNERIESEDITRFEVRFLEVLRNILEWVRDKIDSKIESSEEEKEEKKERKGLFRETYQRYSFLSLKG